MNQKPPKTASMLRTTVVSLTKSLSLVSNLQAQIFPLQREETPNLQLTSHRHHHAGAPKHLQAHGCLPALACSDPASDITEVGPTCSSTVTLQACRGLGFLQRAFCRCAGGRHRDEVCGWELASSRRGSRRLAAAPGRLCPPSGQLAAAWSVELQMAQRRLNLQLARWRVVPEVKPKALMICCSVLTHGGHTNNKRQLVVFDGINWNWLRITLFLQRQGNTSYKCPNVAIRLDLSREG